MRRREVAEPDAVPAGFASRVRGARAAPGLHSGALRPPAGSRLTVVSFTSPPEAWPEAEKSRVARREAPASRQCGAARTSDVALRRRAAPSGFLPRDRKTGLPGPAKQQGR